MRPSERCGKIFAPYRNADGTSNVTEVLPAKKQSSARECVAPNSSLVPVLPKDKAPNRLLVIGRGGEDSVARVGFGFRVGNYARAAKRVFEAAQGFAGLNSARAVLGRAQRAFADIS